MWFFLPEEPCHNMQVFKCVCACVYVNTCVCVCVCVCEGHLINKVNWLILPQELAIRSTVTSFSRKSIVMGPFMSQKTMNMTFFTDHYTSPTTNLFFRQTSPYQMN